MKKRMISVLLLNAMLLTLAMPETKPVRATEAGTTEENEVAGASQAGETKVDTVYFSFSYGEGWTFDPEEDLDEYSLGSRVTPQVPDPDSSWDKVMVSIEVLQNDADDFAENMFDKGMDAELAITGNSDYPTRNIGGVDCWVSQSGSYTYYYGYMPEENAFIYIFVSENDEWDAVDPLIDSIEFHVPAYGGSVIPWYWEGTPYSASEHNTMVGSFTVNCKQLPIDTVNPTFEIFDARIQVSGSDYYIMDNHILKKYTREGDTLKYDSDIALPYEPKDFSVGQDGTIYLSTFGKPLTKIQNGTEIAITSDTDYVAINPSCTWGVSYFSKNEVAKIDLTNGAITNYTLDGIKTVSHLFVTDNYIVISCTFDTEETTFGLKVYDTDFNEKMSLDKTGTTTGYYGSVSAVTETANGLFVIDGNMRDVYFIDNDMQLIAAVDMPVLMGTNYPWACGAVTLEDGSIIVLCTDSRADKSCEEAVVFQITGF